jgi:NADH-quinone oxidoreductase subunit E/NADP-reducing hydrogenase subunit HndA
MTSLSTIEKGIGRSGVSTAPYEQALWQELSNAMEFYQHAPDALIQILHRAQELFGYLREDVVKVIAHELRLPISRVHGVIGFYSFFSRVPQGKYTVSICLGTGCYVKGADQILRGFEKSLGISAGQTTADGRFSLRCVRCVGACGVAPVAMVGNDLHTKLKMDSIKKVLKAYK